MSIRRKLRRNSNQSSESFNFEERREKQIMQKSSNTGFIFNPPENFDCKQPGLWEKWSKRFERYRLASGLDQETEVKQISSLIYCMGPDAEDILLSAHLSSEDENSYEEVKKAFDDIFIGKRNVIYERAKFNSRNKKQDENFDTFLADISSMAEHCAFKGLIDELIQDRIVVGISDKKLAAQLQEDSNLTLDKAIQKCKLKETISKQSAELETIGKQETFYVSKISSCQNKNGSSHTIGGQECWNCGSPRHPRAFCPAKDVSCSCCEKLGHFAKLCKSKFKQKSSEINKNVSGILHMSQDESSEAVPAYLGQISSNSVTSSSSWYVNIQI